MDTSGECMDRAGNGVGCVMADDAATGAILLVGDAHSGAGSHGENGEVCIVGNDGVVGSVEGYIAYPELLLGASAVITVMAGIFADVKQIVEGNGAHVADGLYFDGWQGATLLDQEVD